ncbi:MAG: radical SAM protein [Desulfobulbaceae bacterium]|nr:radical SAM protein [Desulfobulbaceae bacterium]
MKKGEEPGYLALYRSGELARRVKSARQLLASCELCPRRCLVDRLRDKRGVCRTGEQPVVASYNPHFGEEASLVGTGGSGAVFFSNCNLLCVFCQNYEISHQGEGVAMSGGQLAAVMLSLQKQGCHNVNLVTPSHVVPQILEALLLAVERGLVLPLVYNSSGYDRVETLQLLDGVVDIYMPDFKFWEQESGRRYAVASDYPEQARLAIGEMHRQVGDLIIDDDGVARRGLLVRHLVMPGGVGETEAIMRFLAEKVSPATYVNLMDQYHPCGRAGEFPALAEPLAHEEYQEAVRITRQAGISRLEKRDLAGLFRYLGSL